MQESQTSQHEWLMQFIGEWTFEHEYQTASDEAPSAWTGTERVRAIGDLWIVGEMTSKMPEGPDLHAVTTLGYDPRKPAFVGTWVGSPMSHMCVYEGTLDDESRVLTLDCQSPSFEDPSKLSDYRDIVEFISPDERRIASELKKPDGSWKRFMEGAFYRQGS